MDLRTIANSAITAVNPDTYVGVRRSNGYTIGAGRKQIPAYDAAEFGYANIQALSSDDIKQTENLNIQGTVKSCYFKGRLKGVVRPEGEGGDLVDFDNQTWLVVKVLESWSTWTKAVICLQE